MRKKRQQRRMLQHFDDEQYWDDVNERLCAEGANTVLDAIEDRLDVTYARAEHIGDSLVRVLSRII